MSKPIPFKLSLQQGTAINSTLSDYKKLVIPAGKRVSSAMDGMLKTIHGSYRGREEPYQTLPSLRTVRAVLPHTALQSAVSISGQIDDLNLLQGASVIATE